ncbi:unnamed protein product [Brassicogethes aeneus]|uniref:C2H2-type domain-containing protein n=1 Tax=Brassicogethes aeneus TaxID=1431903 RepID=A0A9P0AQU9_BRAAE|nr:unnamed protein product [Brassicogethes aeneus]
MAEDPIRYGELCRLCATKTSLVMAINIFENEGEIRQISKKIESCLQVQIHQADELPKMICENCLYKLELLSEFRERSTRTERILLELYKEINSSRLHEQPPILVDQSELLMVQPHHLLNEHNLENIDLRDDMMVEHEIILTHHNVDINTHSLDSLDLNSHSLTNQELSNQSLQTQESIIIDAGNSQSLQDSHFEDENLSLIHQHHLLSDQLRLHHGLSVNINDESSINELSNQNLKSEAHHNTSYLQGHSNKNPEIYEETINDLSLHNYNETMPSDMKTEDSDSASSLVTQNKQIYIQPIKNDFEVLDSSEKQDWYFCNMCSKSYKDNTEFEKHYESHFKKCSKCYAVFSDLQQLNEHLKTHSAELYLEKSNKTRLKPSTVPVNDEIPPNEDDPKEESDADCDNGQIEDAEAEAEVPEETEGASTAEPRNVNGKKKKTTPKICTYCGKSYKTNYKLVEHLRKHTGEKPFQCGTCDKSFRSKIGLTQHEAVHTGQYLFACPTCGKGFQCKSYLMVHQRVHSDVKPYHCTTCGQDFKTKQSLLDHTNRHLGVKPYICDICGRGFITKGLCRAHEKIHTGLDNRKYACKICSKLFVSKSYLQTHLRIHTGEKPFMCEVCGKGFLTRVDLKIHSTLHTGEKSFVCEICGKAFARRDALRCHRRSHTGERPYSCEVCGQTFTQFTPMAIHKRLHTGERPYSCETCGKTFVSRSTMMSHAKKHVR